MIPMRNKEFNVFIGTLPPPIGGQAIISQEIIRRIPHQLVINTSYTDFLKFTWIYLSAIFKFTRKVPHITNIYTVISRGKLSIWRELIFLIIAKTLRKDLNVINHLHGNDFEWIFEKKYYSNVILKLYKKYTSVTICVNDYQYDTLTSKGLKAIRISNPLVNLNLKISLRNIGLKRQYTYGYISFIMSSKGIFDVLEMILNELGKGKNISLVIAGEIKGDEELNFVETKRKFFCLINEANNLKENSIKYIGVVSGKLKEDFYLSFNFLLFLSRFKSESFGLVLIEAMSYGVIPIINENKTLIRTLKGYTFAKLDDIQKSRLDINKFSKKAIENNRSRVIFEHDSEKFINELKQLYE